MEFLTDSRSRFLLVISLFFFMMSSISQAMVTSVSKVNLLHQAITENDLPRLLELLDSGLNVDAQVEDNVNDAFTPLLRASLFGRIDVVKELLKRGANVEAQDSQQQTPLWHAANEGYAEIVRILLEGGANKIIDQTNSLGRTPLAAAMANYQVSTASVLILNGADVSAKEPNGSTPLHAAVTGGFTDMIQFLIDRGADVNAVEYRSNTRPIHIAASRGHKKIMKLLIARGADPKACNWQGQTAEELLEKNKK